MLRSFRVANHKSFRDEAELLLLPAYDKSRPVVPVAGIFGANASGKSNLLGALHWMQVSVRDSYAGWLPGGGVPRHPFRLDPEAAARPSGFCVGVTIDQVLYTYGFEADDERIRTEWLYAYPRNRRRIIFERDGRDIRLGSTIPDHRARVEFLAKHTRRNALFLTVAAHNDLAEVDPVFQWFRTGLVFGPGFPSDHRDRERDQVDPELTRWLPGPGPDHDRLVALVRAADLGISDITLRPQEAPKAVELLFHHGSLERALTAHEQSAGTISWLGLAQTALRTLDRGGVLVVDEIDASLHPHLTSRLIELFRDAETNPQSAQLLFTTHDATLLDDEILARDEIWFVEKNPDSGVTTLYPLTDFHPRKHENVEGRYLAGGYGAVPVLTHTQFSRALEAQRSTRAAA